MDVELNWTAEGALVDGKPWPVQSATSLHLPAGAHVVEPAAPKREGISLIDLNAKLRSAFVESGKRVVFAYSSESRAIARFDRKPSHLDVDGMLTRRTPSFCCRAATTGLPRRTNCSR